MKNIAVIGAGLTGLSSARMLVEHANVQIFDKSRGVSGRMSTRYTDEFEFDHGAQYFTARHPNFRQEIITATAQGHVAPWQGRAFYKKKSGLEPDNGDDRFTATPRMNSWAKHLAAPFDIKLGTRITDMQRGDGKWALMTEKGDCFDGFDAVVLAIPSPQAEALLPQHFKYINDVKQTKMDACFALMLGFDDLPDLGWDSLRVEEGPAAWMAVNSSKPDRASAPTLMVHADAAWSNLHAEDNREDVASMLLTAASQAAGLDLTIAKYQTLHRWLYASVSAAPNMACLHDEVLSLAVCGDWCLGGRVENAFLSGQAAARQILNAL